MVIFPPLLYVLNNVTQPAQCHLVRLQSAVYTIPSQVSHDHTTAYAGPFLIKFCPGTLGGPSEGQCTSGQALIKEDNALSMLQREFPKEVKYASKTVHDGRLVSAAASEPLHTSPMGAWGEGRGCRPWGPGGPYNRMGHWFYEDVHASQQSADGMPD